MRSRNRLQGTVGNLGILLHHRFGFYVKLALAVQLFSTTTFGDEIDFNRDVRPILSGKCFACHGPDARSLQGGLRLDLQHSVTSPAESGSAKEPNTNSIGHS